MPAVALELVGGERDLAHGGQAGLRPLLIATAETDDRLVAEVFEGFAGQHRAEPGLTIEHDGRRLIRHGAGHAEFEEAPADVGGAPDVTVAVFVWIADVNDHERLTSFLPALQVGRSLFGNRLPGLMDHFPQCFHHADVTPNSGRVKRERGELSVIPPRELCGRAERFCRISELGPSATPGVSVVSGGEEVNVRARRVTSPTHRCSACWRT